MLDQSRLPATAGGNEMLIYAHPLPETGKQVQ